MGKKIIVVTAGIDCGGITSFLIPLVNTLVSSGNYVTVAYTFMDENYLERFDTRIKFIKYKQPSTFDIIKSSILNGAIIDLLKIKFRSHTKIAPMPSVQRIIYSSSHNVNVSDEVYDIAISAAEFSCNSIVANSIRSARKIGWVHPDMGKLNISPRLAAPMLAKFEKVVTVSEVGLKSLVKLFPFDEEKFVYIENMMDADRILSKSREQVRDVDKEFSGMNIVSVSRIDNSSKRIDRMVRIALKLKQRHFKFRWYIVGDGKDYNSVMRLITDNKLENEMVMLGLKSNPYPYIAFADVYVMTSQYEGKPISVEEAKILHTPIITTEYSSAKEQIPDSMGMIVPNVDGILEEQIADVIMDTAWINRAKTFAQDFTYNDSHIVKKLTELIR